ncbi:MAG: glycosyltransferase family 4 protein [Candidatus Krumholzibacteriia bacterium]
MKVKRALLIGPFPPPIGGDTVLTLNVSRSGYWREHGIMLECIDTSPGDRVRVPDERLVPGDLLRGARVFLELVVRLPRCDAVLLWANNRFLVTAGLAVIAWSSLWRKPVFVKVFGAYLARRIRRIPRPWRRLALHLLGKAACVFPETRFLARELVDEGWLPAGQVLVLPNFLTDKSFGHARAPKPYSGRCVFFGQIKREKGVFDIIDALGGEANAICDFYGPVLDRDRAAFLEAISKYRNLSYGGSIEPGLVSRVAAGYDVLLLPTFHESEGYPAVILEAYAAGIPVIATEWLSLPEIVENGTRGILVPVKSPGKIREALGRFAADELLYESMCGKARAFAENYSEQAVLNGILIPRVSRAFH